MGRRIWRPACVVVSLLLHDVVCLHLNCRQQLRMKVVCS